MFYYIKFYARFIFLSAILLLVALLFYHIANFQESVVMEFGGYTIYTKQNVVIFLFLAFCYLGFKTFSILIGLNSFFISLKYKFSEKIEAFKAYFNFKQKKEAELLEEIANLRKKRLYKKALRITSENYAISEKLLFWHFFMLLKLGRRREFIKLFRARPTGFAVKLFTLVYLKNSIGFLKIIKIKRLYLQNPDNQVFTYIYANSLFTRGHVKKAQGILMNFINNKRILMTDIYASYLMNMLAIKIEKQLNGADAENFILDYKENIETYYEKTKK